MKAGRLNKVVKAVGLTNGTNKRRKSKAKKSRINRP